MRTIRPSLKILLAISGLAALWLNAPQLNRVFVSEPIDRPDSLTRSITANSPIPDATEDHRPSRPKIDPSTLPAGAVWTFKDGDTTRTYALAMDELYIPTGAAAQRLHALPSQPNLNALLEAAAELTRQTGIQPRLVLYPLAGSRDDYSRRIVTAKVHLEAADSATALAATSSLGITDWKTPDYAPGHIIARIKGDPAQPLRAAAALAEFPGVVSAVPLLARQHAKRAIPPPNDPLFPQQWHLRNTGQQNGTLGVDINVLPIWSSLTGAGISIGIVDDGVQFTHPDLAPNVAADGHYDWNDQDTTPAPDLTVDYHGTAVAGLAVARGNNGVGVSGAAPQATLYGLRLIAETATDEDDAEAMTWKNDLIHIKNNSWGPVDDTPWILEDAGSLWKSAVAAGTTTGRGGRGTIYVWAAGNGRDLGDQGSKDGYSSNRHVIPVGAVTNRGFAAYYSEGGAHLVTCAPGESSTGLLTTDLTGAQGYNNGYKSGEISNSQYTQTFSGTSAATPLTAGVIALMVEANPQLGWRDVKEILLRTSTQLQSTSPDWITRTGGQPGLPVIKHHPLYGGGLINAQAATALASTWSPLGPETSVTRATTSSGWDIPDAGPAVTIPLTPASSPALRVEHVELTVSIVHGYRGDLEIKLTSPSGVVSTLATPTYDDDGEDYGNWTFTSVRHWGENSTGTWKVSIRDALKGYAGYHYVVSASLKIHGVALSPPTVALQPEGFVAAKGSTGELTAAGIGPSLSYQWLRNGTVIAGANAPTLSLPGIMPTWAGAYTCRISNAAGTVTTDPANVVVYDAASQSRTLNPGTTFNTGTFAAGPIDSLRWFRDGAPLTDNSRISGSATGTLIINNATAADNGAYMLQAVHNETTLPTGVVTLTVRPRPDVSMPTTIRLRLGATATLPLTTDDRAYTYRYTSLPKGLAYNPMTGALIGRPTLTGTFPIVLTATDIHGLATTINTTLVIEPLPASIVGVFNGYVERDATLNANLGGALTLTTTVAGRLTGRLTLGTGKYSFKGALDGVPGGPATASISILRKGLAPLTLQLSLPLDDTVATGTVDSTVAITAWRNAWSKTTPAIPHVGSYTFALDAPAGLGWPTGHSTGTLTVAPTGVVKWMLQPADGTAALKGATTLSADGTVPLFAPVRTPAGSFVGHLTVPPVDTLSASITGEVSWLRRATTSTVYANPAGFGPLDLTLHGGRYTTPATGTLLLGLPARTGNVDLVFDDTEADLGAQAPNLTPLSITLSGANKVVPPLVNPTRLKLVVKTTTGQFSGSFVLTDPSPVKAGATVTRSGKFSGVFLLPDGIGAGFFIVPPLPGSGSGTQSGSVLFMESAP